MSSYISRLALSQFRSYTSVRFNDLLPGLVVLHGANGAGKTNVLEAISLLTPGRGLRSAKNEDIQNCHNPAPWAVSAEVMQACGVPVRLGTGMDAQSAKRIVRIEGQTMRGQNALAEHMACVWLTPQMDRLFLDSAAQRRKFFDRLLYAFDPGHAGRIMRYDNALGQRSKILRESAQNNVKPSESWLTALESQMAETACAIAAARCSFIRRLQAVCSESFSGSSPVTERGRTVSNPFPEAGLQLRGTLESLLERTSALDVEDMFKQQLRTSRPRDALTGGAQTGPHKTDLIVSYAQKNHMPAEQCSTGEQKALLIGIILAHAHLIAAERGAPPLLLLDEVAAHLDEGRRAALYALLQELGGQVWLTGTDANLFDAIKGSAQFYEVSPAPVGQSTLVAV